MPFLLYACLFSSKINVMFGINRGRIYSNTASYLHGDAVNFSFHCYHYKLSSKKNINFLLTQVQIGSGAHPTFPPVYTKDSVHRHARAGACRANDHSPQMPKERKHRALSPFSHVFKAYSLTFTEWSLNANVLLPAWILRHVKDKNEPIWKSNLSRLQFNKAKTFCYNAKGYMVTWGK